METTGYGLLNSWQAYNKLGNKTVYFFHQQIPSSSFIPLAFRYSESIENVVKGHNNREWVRYCGWCQEGKQEVRWQARMQKIFKGEQSPALKVGRGDTAIGGLSEKKNFENSEFGFETRKSIIVRAFKGQK